MKNIKKKSINLDSLGKGIPALSKGKAILLKETCVWCLNACKNKNGTFLHTKIINEDDNVAIKWKKGSIDNESIKNAYNKDDAIEFGAEAISVLLIREFTGFTAIRRAVNGTGIDYWLGDKSVQGNNIFNEKSARLEISGILEESNTNTVKRRLKTKLKQTEKSDRFFPVYISIVEFKRPYAEMVLKNV